ncbi:hypothetical protein FKM82_026676 [Ascaphus truei]
MGLLLPPYTTTGGKVDRTPSAPHISRALIFLPPSPIGSTFSRPTTKPRFLLPPEMESGSGLYPRGRGPCPLPSTAGRCSVPCHAQPVSFILMLTNPTSLAIRLRYLTLET